MSEALLFDGSPEEPQVLEEAVFQALGAVSVCWENPAGAGTFDTDRARQIGEELVAYLRGYLTRRFDLADLTTRRFQLVRREDESGVSGTGVVAFGVQFADGVCVLRWASPAAPASTNVYACVADVKAIHGHGGKTVVEWVD